MTVWGVIGWAITGGSVALLLAALVWIGVRNRRLAGHGAQPQSSAFSVARYQPMEGLLSERDFRFLASQPGYRPEIGNRWKRERRRIVRLYLRELKQDFARLHAEARVMVAQSQGESPELVRLLLRQQVLFWFTMAGLEVRLALSRAGMGHVDPAPLVALVESMRVDLLSLSAPAQSA